MSKTLVAVLATAVAFAGGTLALAATPVPETTIKELFAGKIAHRKTRNGLPITITFYPGGKLEGVVQVGGVHDLGRWWTRHGRLCYQWQKLANARRSCVSVESEDGRIIVGSLWQGWDEIEGWLARPSW